MSDVARQVTPGVIDWLADYARIAVQIFLVMGGYLAAASLVPQGVARFDQPLEKIGKRALRLLAPYSVALLFAVLIAALVRPWFAHESVPGEPSWHQLIANALMLQDITGEDALSAGVWYVAIDFQLFAAVTLLFAATRGWTWRWMGLSVVSFEVEFRLRIAVALASAVALLWLMRVPSDGKTGCWLASHVAPLRWLQSLGQFSYSVFLVHFSIVVLCNAVASQVIATQPWLNWLGMCAAFGLSLLAGRVLYHFVETRTPSLKGVARWELGFIGAGLAVSLLSARFAL